MTVAYFRETKHQAQLRILPALRAIYEKVDRAGQVKVRQTGTGTLICFRGRIVLLTAKHCLYGHRGDENPGDKLIMTKHGIMELGSLAEPTMVSRESDDLAAFYVDEAVSEGSLDVACL